MRTIITSTIINSNINIRKINWGTFILLIEKCDLCAVYPPFFDSRGLKQDERACVTIRVQSIFFYPATLQPSQITPQLAGSQTTPETERGKTRERRKECRAGKTDASSAAEIWQVVVRQLSVQIQTRDLVGVRVCVWNCMCETVCVHVVTCSSPDHRGLMRKFNQLSYTERLEAIYLTVLCYRSVLSPAGQGQAAGQHSSLNQSGAWLTCPQRRKALGC